MLFCWIWLNKHRAYCWMAIFLNNFLKTFKVYLPLSFIHLHLILTILFKIWWLKIMFKSGKYAQMKIMLSSTREMSTAYKHHWANFTKWRKITTWRGTVRTNKNLKFKFIVACTKSWGGREHSFWKSHFNENIYLNFLFFFLLLCRHSESLNNIFNF